MKRFYITEIILSDWLYNLLYSVRDGDTTRNFNTHCCIVNAWLLLIAALLFMYAIPFNYLSYRFSMRVSAELLLVPRLPFSVGRNLIRRDGGFHSLFVALHDAFFFSCWLWTQLYFPLFQMCSVVIFWHKATLIYLPVIHQFMSKYYDATYLDAYPLPRIDDQLNEIAQHKYFSKLDLTSTYYETPLCIEDRPFTAFEAKVSFINTAVWGYEWSFRFSTYNGRQHRAPQA